MGNIKPLIVLSFVLGSLASNIDLLGNFVFNTKAETKGSKLSVLHKPDSVLFTPSPGAVKDEEIASILSLSLGSSIPKDIEWKGLQFGDVFNRPKAAAIVTIDGLPKDAKFSLPSSHEFPLELSDSFTLDNLVSVQPGFSLTGHINKLYDEKSTSVSMAANEGLAFAGGNSGENGHTLFWQKQTGNWLAVDGDDEQSKVFMTRSEIIKSISSDYVFNKEDNTVTVIGNNFEAVFHMEDEVDFNLFSELSVIKKHLTELTEIKGQLFDHVPDVFTFTISALKGLERKYGEDSRQMLAALHIIQAFLPKIRDSFKNIYGEKVLIVAATITSQLKELKTHHKEIHGVLHTLKEKSNVVTDAFNDYIPELHVPSNIAEKARNQICHELEGSLAKFSGILKFKCKTQPEVHRLSRRSLSESKASVHANNNYNIASEYDENFAVIFNIWFWLVVILALALYAISVAMWNMDPGRDSIIYRLTQPKIKAE